MSSFLKTIAAAAVLTIGFGSASTLYAAGDQPNPSHGSQAQSGLMGNGGMMGQSGMMGQNGGTGGMMNMMGRMNRMMGSCDQMMRGGIQVPNSQWNKPSRG